LPWRAVAPRPPPRGDRVLLLGGVEILEAIIPGASALVVWDENPVRMPPPVVTLSLIIVNIAVFLLTYLVAPSMGIPVDSIFIKYGLVPVDVLTGHKLYTILTSMFLHGGITHIVGNMLYLYVFGDNTEAAMGRRNFLILYFASGIGATIFHLASTMLLNESSAASNLLNYGITPWEIPAVGASGAISGVLAAYYLYFPRSEIKFITFIGILPVFLRLPAGFYIMIWFVFQLLYAILTLGAGVSAGIAFWAHVGGFITGLALAPRLVDRERLRTLYMNYLYL